jgi:bile acid-coenzyme A ligase
MTILSMVSVWARMARDRPDAPALTISDQPSVTWGVLQKRSNQLARRYAEMGVVAGDLVTIALPTCVDAAMAILATIKLGATPSPISSKLPPAERHQIIALANPRLIVGEADETLAAYKFVPAHPDLKGMDDSDLPEVISKSVKAPTSGGSTGRPKIIRSGAPAVVDDDPNSLLRRLHFPVDGCCLCAGPIYHNTTIMAVLVGLASRNHVVLEERFDAELTLKLIQRHKVSFAGLVPTMMSRIQRLPEEVRNAYDLSSLRAVQHNAAPCSPELKRFWISWLGPDRIFENYTATEQPAITAVDGNEWLAKPGTVGKCIVGEIEVRDDQGVRCPDGVVGSIWMRRPKGAPRTFSYIGQETPDAEDGWETVGDLGYLDSDGYLFLADRRTDMIISGGSNIYPAEVENAINAHPDVIESVVVGLPDDDMGQKVHAIVSVASKSVDVKELGDFVRQRIASYKCPRSYELTRESLRDDSGKVRRSSFKERAVARSVAVG